VHLSVQVLGSLALMCGPASAAPSASKPRSLLALLLLHADQSVPAPALIKELWSGRPPASAPTTVPNYVMHIRRRLGAALGVPAADVARKMLITVPGGYRFESIDIDFDLHRYLRLSVDGQRALADGDNVGAAESLTAARALWRGPPLADVRAGPLLRPQLEWLAESRLVTIEESIEARMRLGGHREVLSDLAGLTAEHRLHENLHAQFMLALHRSGRRQGALRVFHRLRATMIEELGLEPSKRLHMLQQAILADDPALEATPRIEIVYGLYRDAR
jgi:SARP family transcriptional regulator, regulator of embCAB operon